MWTVAHSTFGSMVGSRIRSPWLAGVAGVFSHVLLDSVPHWDYAGLVRLRVWVSLDQASALLILLWALKKNPRWRGTLAAATMAAIPDIEGAFIYFGWQDRYYFPSHLSGFPHSIASTVLGTLTQVSIIAICLFLIARQKIDVLRSV